MFIILRDILQYLQYFVKQDIDYIQSTISKITIFALDNLCLFNESTTLINSFVKSMIGITSWNSITMEVSLNRHGLTFPDGSGRC